MLCSRKDVSYLVDLMGLRAVTLWGHKRQTARLTGRRPHTWPIALGASVQPLRVERAVLLLITAPLGPGPTLPGKQSFSTRRKGWVWGCKNNPRASSGVARSRPALGWVARLDSWCPSAGSCLRAWSDSLAGLAGR